MFVDAITNITTIISNLQTNFGFMPRALYGVFQIVVRGGGVLGWIFLPGGENLRSDLDNLNFSQIKNSILWILNTN